MIIFDLDSTVVDARRCTQQLGDWDAYADELEKCPAYAPLAYLVEEIQECQKIVMITGRSEKRRHATEEWLVRHGLHPDELLMRPDLNSQPEPELFARLLDELLPGPDYPEQFPMAWGFTGREKIAEAFRTLGIQSLTATPMVGIYS